MSSREQRPDTTVAGGSNEFHNTLHVRAAKSYCASRLLGLDRPRLQRAQLQRNEESSSKAETHPFVAGGSTINFRRIWSLCQSELATQIWGCLSAECTQNPLSTSLRRPRSPTDVSSILHSSINDFTMNNRPLIFPVDEQHAGGSNNTRTLGSLPVSLGLRNTLATETIINRDGV